MKNKIISGLIFLYSIIIISLNSGVIFAQSSSKISARDISIKAANSVDLSSLEMTVTLKIYSPSGNERVKKFYSVSRKFGDVTKTLIRFISPPETKGTAILIYDNENSADDLWIYLPSIRKTRRILSTEKGNSFMGSEFTNSDMSKPNAKDFIYNNLGVVIFDKKECWRIECLPINNNISSENGFYKKISLIDISTFQCYKVEFFGQNGELTKTEIISDYQKISENRYIAKSMNIQNHNNGRLSVMNIDNYKESDGADESSFSPSRLQL